MNELEVMEKAANVTEREALECVRAQNAAFHPASRFFLGVMQNAMRVFRSLKKAVVLGV